MAALVAATCSPRAAATRAGAVAAIFSGCLAPSVNAHAPSTAVVVASSVAFATSGDVLAEAAPISAGKASLAFVHVLAGSGAAAVSVNAKAVVAGGAAGLLALAENDSEPLLAECPDFSKKGWSNYTCLRLLSSQANLTCRVKCLKAFDKRVEARNQAKAEAAAAEAHAKAVPSGCWRHATLAIRLRVERSGASRKLSCTNL